jgi:hypothetical protein
VSYSTSNSITLAPNNCHRLFDSYSMATFLQDLVLRLQQGDQPSPKLIIVGTFIAVALATIISTYLTDRPYKNIPMSGEATTTIWQAKTRWLSSARKLMVDGLQKVCPVRHTHEYTPRTKLRQEQRASVPGRCQRWAYDRPASRYDGRGQE